MLAADSQPASAAQEVFAQAGGGDAGIAVNVFSPASIAVTVGDTVTWENPYTEPHSVAFDAGDVTELGLEEAHNAGAAAAFDGSETFSSGLFASAGMFAAGGSDFSVTFKQTGQYTFFCTIHPGMEVTVTVVNSGAPPIDQDRIESRVATGLALGLAAADAIEVPGPKAGSGGTKVWTIPTPPTVPYEGSVVDVLRFTPVEVNIGAGDTVTWENTSFTPHTVTFLPGPPPEGFSPFVPAVSSTNYAAGTFLNSGLIVNDEIGAAFGGVGESFSLTFNTPGTYQYLCALHADSGMVGIIKVGAAGSGGITPPNTGDAGLLDKSSGSWLMLAGVAMLALSFGGGLILAVRKSA
jgi:plastocyanin